VITEEPATQATVRLDAATIETLASRIAALLSPLPTVQRAERIPSGRLLSAAEVSAWCGVSRGWVYQHATKLGAVRIGDGERPRLRFDPDRVAEHLNHSPAVPPPDHPKRRPSSQRSRRIRTHSRRLAFRADPELSSPPRRGTPGQTGASRRSPRVGDSQ
jgi:hypothetical protein